MKDMRLELSDFCGMRGKDVVGLWYGYKKIVSTGIEPARAGALEATFRKYGLHFALLNEGHDYKKRSPTYLISKKTSHLRLARSAYARHRYDLVGLLLGYPECCVRRHFRLVRAAGRAGRSDFVRCCSAGTSSFRWRLNNLLDFDGRLCGRIAAGLDLSKVPHASLISHNPCSYDCRASLEIAKKNWAFLGRQARRAETDPSLLAKPALYADDFNFVILDGSSGAAGIEYSGAAYVLGLGEIRRRLVSGDRLQVSGMTLKVFRGRRTILVRDFTEEPLVLPFDRGSRV